MTTAIQTDPRTAPFATAMATFTDNRLTLGVTEKRRLADGIHLFELQARDGLPLPAFGAGAHVLIDTPAGLARRYSLCNAPGETHRYCVAVKRDPASRGGSASMIDDVEVGMQLSVSAPENYFALDAGASEYLLIAGGIGITPLRAMMAELDARNAPWRLIYCTRTPETTAFLDELAVDYRAGRVEIHHDFGDASRSLNFEERLATRHGDTHLYCCGPRALMQAVRDATSQWPASSVHFEDFGTSAPLPSADDAGEKPFVVRLQRSNVTVEVAPGQSILSALREHGIETPSSCEAGTCGKCRTTLCAGTADHRDFVLDDDEYDHAIMICVSRAKSSELVLDL